MVEYYDILRRMNEFGSNFIKLNKMDSKNKYCGDEDMAKLLRELDAFLQDLSLIHNIYVVM